MSFLLLSLLACPAPDDKPVDDTGAVEDTGEGADTSDTNADTADTAGDPDTGVAEDADGDGVLAPDDCDDNDASVYPGATEVCDGADQDCNGSVDEGFGSVAYVANLIAYGAPTTGGYWYGYDTNDKLVLLAVDAEQDGVLEYTQRYEYEDGLLVVEEHASDGVTPSYRVEYTRNEAGSITEGRVDQTGDGVWDWAYGYWYDGDRYAGYWSDSNYDGDYEYEQHSEYDADGNPSYYWVSDDADGDTDVDQQTWYTYSGSQILSYVSDTDGDGVFETEAYYSYDGARLMEETVSGGTHPSRRTYTYTDADDHYDIVDYDLYADDSVEWRYTYVWDGEHVVELGYDQYADGVEVNTYTYEYDADGNAISATNSTDGVFHYLTEYEWVTGVYAGYRTDLYADGTWDVVARYNPDGTSIYDSVDAAGDGVLDYVRTNDFDERLRRTGSTYDELGDGVLETQTLAVDGYACGSL